MGRRFSKMDFMLAQQVNALLQRARYRDLEARYRRLLAAHVMLKAQVLRADEASRQGRWAPLGPELDRVEWDSVEWRYRFLAQWETLRALAQAPDDEDED